MKPVWVSAVVVDDLDQDPHAAAFEEAIVGEGAVLQVLRVGLPQAVADDPERLLEKRRRPDAFLRIGGIGRGHIGEEALVVQRNLQQTGFPDWSGENAHVHLRFPEFVQHSVGEHFLRLEADGRVPLAEEFEKAGDQHGGDGGNEGDLERSGQRLLFRTCHLGQLVHIEKDHLRPVDDLASDGRGGHRMRIPVEDADIQFLLQFLDHQAQRRLREAAGLGCLAEVPVVVDGDDIAQLLEGHRSVRLILSMQR